VPWHQAVGEYEEENYCQEERDQGEAQVLQDKGRTREDERARQDCERPSEARGEPPISQAEGRLRDSAGQSTDRSGAGKRHPLVQCEEESDRPGRERQAHQPAAHGWPPASPSQAGGPDQCRRKYELQSQTIHELIRPFYVLVLQVGISRMYGRGPTLFFMSLRYFSEGMSFLCL